MSLTIYAHSDKHIVVRGDKDEFAKEMKRFQGRWNSRLKEGEGWLVPVEFESALRAKFDIPATEAKPRLSSAKKTSKSPLASDDEAPSSPVKAPAKSKDPSKTVVRSRKSASPPKPASPEKSPSPAPSDDVAHESEEEQPPTPPPKPRNKAPVRKEKAPKPVDDDDEDELVSIRSQMKETDLRVARLERDRAAKRK